MIERKKGDLWAIYIYETLSHFGVDCEAQAAISLPLDRLSYLCLISFFSLLCSQKALVMMESEMWDERGVTVNGQTGGRFSDLVDDAHIRLLFLFVAY